MANPFDTFEKKKPFLVCVDSDGCAMDTMDIKHFRCFGPCMVREWNLEQWQQPILTRWNEINLYSMTRDVNRFKGLAIALAEIDQQYTAISGLADLTNWVETSSALSNSALEQAIADTGSECLRKALHWSQQVNASTNQLDESLKKPFSGAAEGLAAAANFADVAVVSSANRDAVLEEWGKYGLLDHVDLVLAQDAGSKQHCIAMLLEKGYAPDHVLMVGGAPTSLRRRPVVRILRVGDKSLLHQYRGTGCLFQHSKAFQIPHAVIGTVHQNFPLSFIIGKTNAVCSAKAMTGAFHLLGDALGKRHGLLCPNSAGRRGKTFKSVGGTVPVAVAMNA